MSTIDRYLYKVKRRLPCSHKTKKEIIQCLSDNIEDVLDGDIKVSYAQLCKQFGTPKECVASFKEDIPMRERKQYYKRKTLSWSVPLFSVVAIIILVYFMFFSGSSYTVMPDEAYWADTTTIFIE